jgi:hypothetical protein
MSPELRQQTEKIIQRLTWVVDISPNGLLEMLERVPHLHVANVQPSSQRAWVRLSRSCPFDLACAFSAYMLALVNNQQHLPASEQTSGRFPWALAEVMGLEEFRPFANQPPVPFCHTDGTRTQFLCKNNNGVPCEFTFSPACPEGEWGTSPSLLPVSIPTKDFFGALPENNNLMVLVTPWYVESSYSDII